MKTVLMIALTMVTSVATADSAKVSVKFRNNEVKVFSFSEGEPKDLDLGSKLNHCSVSLAKAPDGTGYAEVSCLPKGAKQDAMRIYRTIAGCGGLPGTLLLSSGKWSSKSPDESYNIFVTCEPSPKP